MRLLTDVSAGDWIPARLRGWGVVGGTVPRGFPAYARIFHPAEARRIRDLTSNPVDVEQWRMRWAEVAAATGRVLHPAAQWGSVSGHQYDDLPLPGEVLVSPPDQGRLPLDLLAALAEILARHTASPEAATAGIWSGWGELHPSSAVVFVALDTESAADPAARREAEESAQRRLVESVHPDIAAAASVRDPADGPLLVLPGREYVLLDAGVREFADPGWARSAGLGWREWDPHPVTPNLLWPADLSWFLASEIDFDSTLVAGSRALVDALLADPRLEAAEVDEDTDLTIGGDTVNPPPAER